MNSSVEREAHPSSPSTQSSVNINHCVYLNETSHFQTIWTIVIITKKNKFNKKKKSNKFPSLNQIIIKEPKISKFN